jgi:hypothetical protein
VFTADCFTILTLRENHIDEITAFLTPEIFPHFDLPTSIRGVTTERRAAIRSATICSYRKAERRL